MTERYFEVSYDADSGQMHSVEKFLGQEVRSMVEVRARLEDRVLREACVYELRKMGYLITPPDTKGEDR